MSNSADRLRDDYVADFAAECIRVVLSWLASANPGELVQFSIRRDGLDDSLELRFRLNSTPDKEYLYRQGVFTGGQDVQMSATTAASVVLGALVERTATRRTASNGLIDIGWGAR